MSTEDEVRQASEHFYAALSRVFNSDAEPMMKVWSQNSDVTLMHPMGGLKVGWEQVRGWWEQIAAFRCGGQVVINSPLIRVVGDLACEVGIESGEHAFAEQPTFFGYRVTNIYRREAGMWKMVHHHADIDPRMIELLKGLQYR